MLLPGVFASLHTNRKNISVYVKIKDSTFLSVKATEKQFHYFSVAFALKKVVLSLHS